MAYPMPAMVAECRQTKGTTRAGEIALKTAKPPNGSRRQGFKRQQKQKGVTTAILKFHPLPEHSRPRGREQRHWARFSSQFKGLIAFPDRRLEKQLKSRNLIGKSVEVKLRCLQNKDQHGKRFEAFIEPNAQLQEVQPEQPLRRCQAPIFVIDGRNFFLSMRAIKCYDAEASPLNIIKGIMGLFEEMPSVIRLYLCDRDLKEFPKEAESLRDFFGELNRQRQNNRYAVIDVRKPKTVFVHHRPKQRKCDMDCVILPSIGFLASENPQSQALVLFTGDSDFHEACRIWLGLNGHDSDYSPLGRQLVIASSQIGEQSGTGALARELRELANKPCVTLALIEYI